MTVSAVAPETLREAFAPLVGGEARLAMDRDAIAGVRPAVVLAPENEEEVAAVLARADRAGLKVLLRGGGTQLGLGMPPAGGDLLLDLSRLNRVVEHTPGDLTVTVEAGTPLARLQATLASVGQWLALDPVLPAAATIGGIVATNASGPRRLRYGGVKDQIIGVRIVRADGTIAKGGGKVVKNVAGFDLPKLLTGSLGTLGVIVAATFRLYPVPAASRTVVVTAPDPAPLHALALRVTASTLVATALDLTGPAGLAGDCALLARFEGLEEAVDDQARELRALADGQAEVLRDEREAAYWREAARTETARRRDGETARRQEEDEDGKDGQTAETASTTVAQSVTLKASLLLTEIGPWLARLRELAGRAGLAGSWRAHAGHGLVFAQLAGAPEALSQVVDELRAVASRRQGSLVVVDAPPALARTLDVWGPSPALAVMRRVKEQFDPRGTLNPGRFVGGL